MHVVSTGLPGTERPPAHAWLAGSPLFLIALLHQIDLKIAFGEQLLELDLLSLKALEAFDVGRLQSVEMPAPGIDGGFADFVLPGRVANRCPAGLLQRCYDLLITESTLSHVLFLSVEEPSLQKLLVQRSRAGQVLSMFTSDNTRTHTLSAHAGFRLFVRRQDLCFVVNEQSGKVQSESRKSGWKIFFAAVIDQHTWYVSGAKGLRSAQRFAIGD
jgi:hypothetical protein